MLDYFLGRIIPAVVIRCAPVAQSAEQGTLNPKVTGSIPVGRTKPKACKQGSLQIFVAGRWPGIPPFDTYLDAYPEQNSLLSA